MLSEMDERHYYYVRDRFNEDHNILDFLFLNRSCFNGMIRFNKNYRFNVPYGHKPQRFSKAYVTKIVNQVKHLENLFPKKIGNLNVNLLWIPLEALHIWTLYIVILHI